MNVLLLHDAVSPTAPPDAQDTLIQAAAVREALTELGFPQGQLPQEAA